MSWVSGPAASRDSNNPIMTRSLSMSELHSQAGCLHAGWPRRPPPAPSFRPTSPASPKAQPLPTRSSQNPSTGPHWPILGHVSVPQPIIASSRMDGSAWPHPGPTPTPVLRVGVSPTQSTQWLIVREAWSRGKSEVATDTAIVDVSEVP